MDQYLYPRLLVNLISAIEAKTMAEINKDDRKPESATHKGSYKYIPKHIDVFIKAMDAIGEDYKKRNDGKRFENIHPSFLDAGCGLGVKLVLAAGMGFKATGIEIDCKLIERAKDIFALDQEKWYNTFIPTPVIKYQDILDHDYSTYDVIYFYCPFIDPVKEAEFEKRMLSQMKQGAYLIPFGRALEPDKEQFDFIENPYAPLYRRK